MATVEVNLNVDLKLTAELTYDDCDNVENPKLFYEHEGKWYRVPAPLEAQILASDGIEQELVEEAKQADWAQYYRTVLPQEEE